MSEAEAIRVVKNNDGLIAIDGCTEGLYYFASKDDDRVAIGGESGITIVTRKQAEYIAEDIVSIFDMVSGKDK